MEISETVSAQEGASLSTQVRQSNGLLSSSISLDKNPRNSQADSAYDPSRIIVRFRRGTNFLTGSGKTLPLLPSQNVHLVLNPPGLSVKEVIARYKGDPNVIYAEPDFIVRAIATTNDPNYPQQWDFPKINAPSAWDNTVDSSSVIVGIVDTGIDFNHSDLNLNLYREIRNSASTVVGYTCINGACVDGGQDNHGHGTHVAGTIGAVTNNSIGVAGLNWRVQLLAMKFLDANGSGAISDAVLAFSKLLDMKTNQKINIRVTNNSWGGGGYSQALKDAMSALENTGVLNVCAAGNSSVNADATPMYPGAYDNKGIVSVLATDSNDVGASFTNYGLSSVDIAAPGVNIYSTAASGTCSLCDGTGYKSLSGTSMASPHVAGVAAALFAKNSALTAQYARDALLNPLSYDNITDPRARTSSSGGRLNYYNVLTNNPYLSTTLPKLNTFPTITVGPDVTTTGGNTISFTQSSNDPDGDTLRSVTGRGQLSSFSAWLMGWQVQRLFPSSPPFIAPNLSRTAAVPYDISVADNRGGGASARNWAIVSPTKSPAAPTGTLTVQSTGTVGTAIPIYFSGKDYLGGSVAWDLNISRGGSSGWCCYSGSSVSWTPDTVGLYRITVQAIDKELNTSQTYSALINVGNGSGVPPSVTTTVSSKSGPAPLTIDVSGSATDTDGTISTYFFDCGTGFASGQSSSQGKCTFSQPGTYWVRTLVLDNTSLMGVSSEYVVVTPSATSTADIQPPIVNFKNPLGGSISGTVTLESNASDDNSGINDVSYYLDGTASSALLGSSTNSATSYAVSWDTGQVTSGNHTIYAIARDNAGNTSQPASVSVSVPAPITPNFSLTVSSTGTISRGKSTNIPISLTPINGSSAITLSINGTLPKATGATFNPSSVSLTSPTNGSSTLTITAGKTAPLGTFSFKIQGTSVYSTNTSPFTLTITK